MTVRVAKMARRGLLCTANGMTILPRTITCRSNDPFKHLSEKTLKESECGRQT